MNAEIRRFKIGLTSDCAQRCRYCFIDKGAGQTLSLEVVKKAVSLFVGSPGAFKKLYIYGGEPLLHFNLLKDTIVFSRREAERLKRHLAIVVSTGGTVIRREHVSLFCAEGVGLCVSVDGDEKTHNSFRKSVGGRETFGKTMKNIEMSFTMLGPGRMGVSQGVHPQNAELMFENFRYLVSLGFENTNLEIIQGVAWPAESKSALKNCLEDKSGFLFKRIREGRPVFPLSICELLASGRDWAYQMCPFHSSFEVFPDGSYSFYPHPFLSDATEKQEARIGTVAGGLGRGFGACRFSPASAKCRGCTERYYSLARFADGDPPELRRKTARAMVAEMLTLSQRQGKFKDYIRQALERAYAGFG